MSVAVFINKSTHIHARMAVVACNENRKLGEDNERQT